jgi:hypothetical protein
MKKQNNGSTRASNSWLYAISATSACLIALLLVVGGIGFILPVARLSTISIQVSSLINNWLMVIFKLFIGVDYMTFEHLQQINLLDLSILILTGIAFLGLYFSLRKTSQIWSLVALLLPFLGILLFLITKTAGRSAFMGSILIISLVMLKSRIYAKATSIIGLVASALLFLGDFTLGSINSKVIVALFGLGYILAIIWFLLIARCLLIIDRD